MNQWIYFLLLLKASLFSTGGMGNLPSLHTDLIARRWASEGQFAEALIIGQVSPGPNGLWVVSLGYLTDGIVGAVIAAIAVSIPPLLVIVLHRVYENIKEHPAVFGFVRGLSLAVIGTFSAVLVGMTRAHGIDSKTAIIGATSFLMAATKRIPIAIIILFAAIVGIIWK